MTKIYVTFDGFSGDNFTAEITRNFDVLSGVSQDMFFLLHPVHLDSMDDLDVTDQVPGSAHRLPTSRAGSVKHSSTLQELPDGVCLSLFLVLVGRNSIDPMGSHLTSNISEQLVIAGVHQCS